MDSPSARLWSMTLSATHALVGRHVVELATGQVVWRSDGALVGFEKDRAIEVRRSGDAWTAIVRRDVRTGSVVSTVPLARSDLDAEALPRSSAALVLAPSRIIYADMGRVEAVSTDSGKHAWTYETDAHRGLVVNGDLVAITAPREVTVHDTASGELRWRAPFDGEIHPSSRGGFFVSRAGTTVELSRAGNTLRTIPGRLVSADEALVAVIDRGDIVVLDDKGRQLHRIQPAAEGDYVAAPGLCRGAVVYFRAKDSTIWWRAPNGSEKPVVKLYGHTALSTETGLATAPATLTTPPRCAGSVLLIEDWTVSAYRIPSR